MLLRLARSTAALVLFGALGVPAGAWAAVARERLPANQPRWAPEGRPLGHVLWNGDFSTGSLSQYAEVAVSPADTAAVVDDPILGSARKALRLTVHNSSRDPVDASSPKHRAHAASPRMIDVGDDVYIGFSVLLPRDLPAVHRPGAVDGRGSVGWQAALHSIYGAPHRGSSTQHLGITRSEPDQAIRLLRNKTYGYDSPWELQTERGTPADLTGRWIDFVIHTRMSANGFREQWVNTGSGFVKQTFDDGSQRLLMKTVDGSNHAGPNHSKLQLYYNDDAWPRATVYFADHRIGTTFDAVAPGSYR